MDHHLPDHDGRHLVVISVTMPISTRTPEGEPLHCPVCGMRANLEISDPAGDALCPACGSLLWQVRDSLHRIYNIPIDEITLSLTFDEITGNGSLDTIELVMELEDLGLKIAEADYERLRSVRDVIQYLRRHKDQSGGSSAV